MKSIPRQKHSEPGLVTFYDIWPGNGADLFLQPRSPHRAVSSQVPNMVTLAAILTELSSTDIQLESFLVA